MILAEPPRTPYDFHFQIMGFHVRVSPFFWLMALVLGWGVVSGDAHFYSEQFLVEYMEQLPPEALPPSVENLLQHQSPTYQERYASNPGQGMLLLIWVAAVFLSILIHELGHCLAMKRYGIHSNMILYHFGGLAVPDSAGGFMGMRGKSDPYQQIYISAAGPGLQLALAGAVILLVKAAGYAVPTHVPYLSDWLHFEEGKQIASLPLLAVVDSILWPSIYWAILNLLPVYPLDGGQISRELFTLYSPHDGMKNSLMLSILAGGGVAVYGVVNDQMMLGMMFGMLAFSSFQILQAFSGRGGGHGPW